MNKKGFTLIEVLVVIVLLGLIFGIAAFAVTKSGEKAKEKTLLTKVNNIEKAAVLYAQDKDSIIQYEEECIDNYPCKTIQVVELIQGEYISGDDNTNYITNPLDKEKTLNACSVKIYKKYGRIYATYIKETPDGEESTKCWK